MEQTRPNYVAKAKNLMMSTVRTTALVIMPLAAAVNAHAGSIALPIGNYACSTVQDSSNGSCSGGDGQKADLGSGVQGIAFFSNGPISFSLSSGSGTSQQITVTMGDDGPLSGAIPGGTAIPLSARFSLTTSSDDVAISNWQLLFTLGTSRGDGTYGSTLIDCATSATCLGGAINVSSVLDVPSTIPTSTSLWETVKLTVSVDLDDDGSLTVNVPNAATWDFDSVAGTTSAVPEPASLGFIATGLALIGIGVRRRKQ